MFMVGIVIAIIVMVALVAVGLYNSLIRKKNQVINVFGAVDALLKKRYDLIPNLVATVQQYMQFEKEVLTKVTELRARALSGQSTDDEKIAIDREISKVLRGIMVAVENYPDLKANQSFMQLQVTLNEVEEQISAARRAYNAAVTDYNNAVEMFPTNIMAQIMNYKLRAVFEIGPEEREPVDVQGLFKRQ
ncbi:MAG: LemA family protein [bacterium]